ncbi:MAG: hypothetical protein QW356_04630 [Candidatus Hadarchaeales archaeon]
MPETIMDVMRKRLEELRERMASVIRPQELKPQIVPGVIGSGRLIEQARVGIDRITARIKERKPALIPAVTEAIAKWEPGRRVKELIPAPASESPVPKETEKPAQEKYRLRE